MHPWLVHDGVGKRCGEWESLQSQLGYPDGLHGGKGFAGEQVHVQFIEGDDGALGHARHEQFQGGFGWSIEIAVEILEEIL